MNDASTTLDRLHDLVLPPAVPWWPLAPGWYLVLALALVVAAWGALRVWKHWQLNAYRREAMRELALLESSAAIAELLRRSALAIAPRTEIAEKTGSAWLDWLTAQFPEPMPDTVRMQLTVGVYDPSHTSQELSILRNYAGRWITHHHQKMNTDH